MYLLFHFFYSVKNQGIKFELDRVLDFVLACVA